MQNERFVLGSRTLFFPLFSFLLWMSATAATAQNAAGGNALLSGGTSSDHKHMDKLNIQPAAKCRNIPETVNPSGVVMIRADQVSDHCSATTPASVFSNTFTCTVTVEEGVSIDQKSNSR